MTPADWWMSLPDEPGREQMAHVIAAHRLGLVSHEWAPLVLGPRLTVAVSRCAARVGEGRLRYDATTQREAGALLGGWLLTPALVDAIWRAAALRRIPRPLNDGHGGPAPDMARASSWRRHDAILATTQEQPDWLIASEGKDWVEARPRDWRAANYGWHDRRGRPLQPLGYAHNHEHSDYSQLGRWVADACSVDGQPARWPRVLGGSRGLDLAGVVGGPLTVRDDG